MVLSKHNLLILSCFLFIILVNVSTISAIFGDNEIPRAVAKLITTNNLTIESNISWAEVGNGTVLFTINWNATNTSYLLTTNNTYGYSLNNSLWTLNYSNFSSIVYAYAINSTGGGVSWADVINGTMLSYAQALNGTLALQANVNQTNTSYLLTTNVTYPYSLNDSLWSLNYSNFSIGWLYATNSTGADSFIANYTNFSNIYSWVLGNSSWNLNYSDYLATKNHALNWTSNWTNFTTIYGWGVGNASLLNNYSTIGYGYAINTSDTDSFIANYTNFSRIYGNVTDYNSSWSSITNTSYYLATNPFSFYNVTSFPQNASLMTYANWNATNTSYALGNNASLMTYANWNATNTSYYLATNPFSFYNVTNLVELDPYWNANATNFTVIYGYALNSSNTFTANYSTFLTHINWAVANNGTLLNYSSALNGTLWLANNVTYAYPLNDSLWSLNYSNFSIGWLYATNSTGADSFIANFTNFTTLYANQVGNASGNEPLWNANYSTFLTHIDCAKVINGTMLSYAQALNGTLLQGSNVTYAYAINGSGWVANYSNFLLKRDLTNLSFYGGNSGFNLTSASQNAVNIRGGLNVTNVSMSSVFFVNETNGNFTIGTPTGNMSQWWNGTGLCIGAC